MFSLSACCKEAKASFPLSPTGPYPLGGTTLADRLAASRNSNHSCAFPPMPASRRASSHPTFTLIWGFDCKFTNYNFKQPLNLKKHLNFTPLAR